MYSDTVSALEKLNSMDIPLCVISNWDISLFRALEMHNLTQHFEFALASHVEGFEKPDPRLFQRATDKLGLEPGDILHVGDNPRDDVAGARRFRDESTPSGSLSRKVERTHDSLLTEIPALLDTL
ncbi:MAG: HAD-IA family hydrolase [Fimbriimonadaceae bacterium]